MPESSSTACCSTPRPRHSSRSSRRDRVADCVYGPNTGAESWWRASFWAMLHSRCCSPRERCGEPAPCWRQFGWTPWTGSKSGRAGAPLHLRGACCHTARDVAGGAPRGGAERAATLTGGALSRRSALCPGKALPLPTVWVCSCSH